MKDRLAGAVLLTLSVVYLWLARDFEAGFLADPVGPKAFPYGIGALLSALSLVLLARPSDADTAGTDPSMLARLGILTLSLVAYAYALEILGFVLSTTLEMVVLVLLFRGPLLRGLAASLALALALFFLFVSLLSIPLPTGRLFGGV